MQPVRTGKDALDERVLLPRLIESGEDPSPFYFSLDLIINYPFSHGRFVKTAAAPILNVQISGNLYKAVVGDIAGKRRLFKPLICRVAFAESKISLKQTQASS